MNPLEWSIVGISAFFSIAGIISWSMKTNHNGTWGLSTPAGWVWIWQAFGTIFIPFVMKWNVWNLIWWFPLGFIICIIIGRILYICGIIKL